MYQFLNRKCLWRHIHTAEPFFKFLHYYNFSLYKTYCLRMALQPSEINSIQSKRRISTFHSLIFTWMKILQPNSSSSNPFDRPLPLSYSFSFCSATRLPSNLFSDHLSSSFLLITSFSKPTISSVLFGAYTSIISAPVPGGLTLLCPPGLTGQLTQ